MAVGHDNRVGKPSAAIPTVVVDPQTDHHFRNGIRFDFGKAGFAYPKHDSKHVRKLKVQGTNLQSMFAKAHCATTSHFESPVYHVSRTGGVDRVAYKYARIHKHGCTAHMAATNRVGPDGIRDHGVRGSMDSASQIFSARFVNRVLQVRNSLIALKMSRNATFTSLMEALRRKRTPHFGSLMSRWKFCLNTST